jgi:predicted Zn finger-like uncharacterized protein
MITTCTGCQTRYRLEDPKVPRRLIRVRCPRCKAVFLLDGTQVGKPEAPADSLVLEHSRENLNLVRGAASLSTETAAAPAAPSVLEPPAKPPVAAKVEPSPAAALEEDESGEAGKRGRRRDKAEMLARALVSDILVYNRDARDKALAEGNLLEALGAEIKKSWELYKEKVTPEVANSTTHFRDALNEILAEGQKVF